MKRVLNAIIISRIHISILYYLLSSAICNTLGVFDLDLIWSISLWHYAVYLFDRVYDSDIDSKYQGEEAFPKTLVRLSYVIIGGLLLSSSYFYFRSAFPIYYWFILFSLTFLYTFPIYKKRIKQIFILKNFYSASVIWTFPILLILIIKGYPLLTETLALIKMTSLFLAVMVIEAFWDIRDASGDLENNIKTIPNVLGIKNTRIYLLILLLIISLLSMGLSTFTMMMIPFVLLTQENTEKHIYHLPIFMLIVNAIY